MRDLFVKAKDLLESTVSGYGPKLRPLKELFGLELTDEDVQRQSSPIPALGRYKDSVAFMENITSAQSIGRKRFMVLIAHFIALSRLMAGYNGKFRKIIGDKLTASEIRYIRDLGTEPEEVKMAEEVEKVSEHDTAAAGDYLKLRILYDFVARGKKFLVRLSQWIDGFHFPLTSEDIMSIVFGVIANELFFVHFMRKLLDFCEFIIGFVERCPALLYIPEFTHDQGAEPTTYGKKVANTLEAINQTIKNYLVDGNSFRVFSGKFNGATGGFVTHYAAYPDIDWREFSRKFVQGFGLHYEEMTFQCVSYAREAQIFRTTMTILDQLVKLAEDFIKMTSAPAQFFLKEKKPGAKASSVMPNKVNLWQIEGGSIMLEKSAHALGFVAEKLQKFPHGGNMKRSFIFRDIGNDMMPAFIALDRFIKEMKGCIPNPAKTEAFFLEYPGMAGSAMQIALKQEGVAGDAYRIIQDIALNQDGSCANAKQYRDALERKISEMNFPVDLSNKLRNLLDYKRLAEPGRKMAEEYFGKLKLDFAQYRKMTNKIKTF